MRNYNVVSDDNLINGDISRGIVKEQSINDRYEIVSGNVSRHHAATPTGFTTRRVYAETA